MRAAIPLVLLLATSVFAQAERDPKTLHDAERSNDDIVARRAFDASARAMLTPKYRDVIEHYAPSSTDLKSAWGDFVAADGTPFLALQIAPSDAASVANAGSKLVSAIEKATRSVFAGSAANAGSAYAQSSAASGQGAKNTTNGKRNKRACRTIRRSNRIRPTRRAAWPCGTLARHERKAHSRGRDR